MHAVPVVVPVVVVSDPIQVRHSGNFSTKNALVTQFMGGINFQIEHHLFPSMSHMHYKEIAPIVRDTCREFSIPYK